MQAHIAVEDDVVPLVNSPLILKKRPCQAASGKYMQTRMKCRVVSLSQFSFRAKTSCKSIYRAGGSG